MTDQRLDTTNGDGDPTHWSYWTSIEAPSSCDFPTKPADSFITNDNPPAFPHTPNP